MARLTVKIWFDENPAALEALRQQRRANLGYRKCVAFLREQFQYPFNCHTALMDFVSGFAPIPRNKGRATLSTADFGRTRNDLKAIEKSDTFFFSSLVNNSPINSIFHQCREQWKNATGGQVVINPVRYRNPTRPGDFDEDEWWAPEVAEYMLDQEIRPHPKLSLMTTKAQATASNPLPGRVDGLTQDRSAVFGHPQLSMRTVPTFGNNLPKIMYSSGAVNEPIFSDTVAGAMAEFHFSNSGIIIEVRDSKFHLREVVFDGEGFTDLDMRVTPEGVTRAPPPRALVTGDTHAPYQLNEDTNECIYGENGIVDTLRPELLYLHDLGDNESTNPHIVGKISQAIRWAEGKSNVLRELEGVREFLREWVYQHDCFDEVRVVSSNHDDFLWRWLEKGERNVESENREVYHRLSYEMIRQAREAEDHKQNKSAFETAMRYEELDERMRFLRLDESSRVGPIEAGMHGHIGTNGCRGSIKNLSRIGTKFVIEHLHGPGIWQGGYQGGHASDPDHGYNVGPSNWMVTQILIHDNFKRQMIHCLGRDWRG